MTHTPCAHNECGAWTDLFKDFLKSVGYSVERSLEFDFPELLSVRSLLFPQILNNLRQNTGSFGSLFFNQFQNWNVLEHFPFFLRIGKQVESIFAQRVLNNSMCGQYTFAPQSCWMSNACVPAFTNVFENIVEGNRPSWMNCFYQVNKCVLLNKQSLQRAVHAEIFFA